MAATSKQDKVTYFRMVAEANTPEEFSRATAFAKDHGIKDPSRTLGEIFGVVVQIDREFLRIKRRLGPEAALAQVERKFVPKLVHLWKIRLRRIEP